MKLTKRQYLAEIFARFTAQNPQPKTELIFHSNFELLIAVMLSAQATDVSVNKATEKLFAVANTPQSIHALGLEKLQSFIKSIGLYRTKAKNIMATCALLCQQADGGASIPSTREALERLPGVGRKTANVVLNCAFQQPCMPVDTHVFRVAKRLRIATGKTPLAVEKSLLKNIPQQHLVHAHHWLILHGRYVCQARKPKCGQCFLSELCPSNEAP
jgi:endonuclease-3